MMDDVDWDRAIARARLVVKQNEGKAAIAEEVNLARGFVRLMARYDITEELWPTDIS